MNHGEKGKNVFSTEFSKGREILQKSKAAIVLVTNGSDSDIVDAEFQRLLNSFSELMKVCIIHDGHCIVFVLELNIVAPIKCTFSIIYFECHLKFYDHAVIRTDQHSF